jgi:uncharacterized membrane protein
VKASRLLEALLDRTEDDPWLLTAVAALIWLASIVVTVALVLLIGVLWVWLPWSVIVLVALVTVWVVTDRRLDD